MAQTLDYQTLRTAVAGAAAFRRVQRLQPGGGSGDKVFPPTYEGSEYAVEERIIDGKRTPCVLLDSVQSQANRIELALKEHCYRGPDQGAEIPVVVVSFAGAGIDGVEDVTSLDAPHRLADAILRDSLLGDVPFRQSEVGALLNDACPANSTGLYRVCPTALVLGLWDSTGPRGGLGAKFQRALVSEIVGVDIAQGRRPTSRIDPLGITLDSTQIFRSNATCREATGCDWTLDESQAERQGNKPIVLKPSEVNHGNVTPSLANDKGQPHHGGVTLSYAQQTVVISLPALRKLHFPDSTGETRAEASEAARAALAALALAGAEWSIRSGADLRSRCLLVVEPGSPIEWECVGADGGVTMWRVDDPMALLATAIDEAVAAGLPDWRGQPVVLAPSNSLAELVRRSRVQAAGNGRG